MNANPILVLAIAFGSVVSSFAQSWMPTSAPSLDWLALASSADGSRLIAGGYSALYTSTNAGATWLSNSLPVHDWTCVASSADGNTLAASVGYPDSGRIYLSTNGGGIWTTSAVPVKQWFSLAMSADGTKLMAAFSSAGPNYSSTNSGATWTTNTLLPATMLRMSWSADGNRWAMVGPSGAIFISTNAGTSWVSNNVHAPFFDMPCLAISADGGRLGAGAGGNGGNLYTSSDWGTTWTTNTVSAVWASVAMSADGRKMIAGCYPAIYTSTNSGANWGSNMAPRISWRAVTVSADGSRLAAAGFPGGIYTWQAAPSPVVNLSLAPANNSLNFSWIVPSTNLVLQLSADLISWTNTASPPALNLTNLQYQVTLPAPASNAFFRLKTP